MTDEQRIESILKEIEYDYIGYDNLHGDDGQGLKVIKEALEKYTPKKPKVFHARVNDFNVCPSCGFFIVNGFPCLNNFCNQKIDWSGSYE